MCKKSVPYIISTGPGKEDIAYLFDGRESDEVLYLMGLEAPEYPLPAIPLQVHLEGFDAGSDIYIDSLQFGEDDPELVRVFIGWDWEDSFDGPIPAYVVEV